MAGAFDVKRYRYAVQAIRIGWPLVIVESLDSIVSITDTFFVSRLGDNAIAAVGLSSYLLWLLGVFGSLYYVGVMVLVSQAFGARDYERAGKVFGESLSATILLSLPVSITGYTLSSSLIQFLGGSGEVLRLGAGYMRIRSLGLVFWFTLLVYDAAFRGSGITKPLLLSSTTAATLNIILDPLLIYGIILPPLGVKGAALASIASIAVGVIINSLLASRVLGFNPLPKPPRRDALLAARLGFPALVERVVFAGGNNVYMKSISRCGAKAIAAHTIGVRIESIAYMPAFAISTAASSIIGNLVGGGKKEEARRAGFEVAGVSALLMLAVGLLLVATSPYAPAVFTTDQATRRMAMIYLILAGISEPGLGVVMTLGGAIRGAGETRVPTIVNLLSLYLARVTPAYILGGKITLLHTCPLTQWIFMDIDILTRTILFLYIYHKFIHKLAHKIV